MVANIKHITPQKLLHWILGKKIKDADGNILGKLNQYIPNWLTTNLNSLIMDRSCIIDNKDKGWNNLLWHF